MKEQYVYERLEDVQLPAEKPVVLTIGTFDGVHRAHQELLREARERTAEHGFTAVLTFQNHPRCVVSPEQCPFLLTPWKQKRQLLLDQGVNVVVGIPFDTSIASIPPEDFVREIICGRFQANVVLCGPAFHFGHKGRGNAALLAEMGKELGYEFHCCEPVMLGSAKVSSTRIREELVAGNVHAAEELLGRRHFNEGIVVTGDRLGRTIGFPTANLEFMPDVLVPKDGVYAVWTRLPNGEVWPSMMNIGWRPTIGGHDHRKETHLIGFDGELVGETLRVEYVKRLRDETRFSGLDELKAQLTLDREAALGALQ